MTKTVTAQPSIAPSTQVRPTNLVNANDYHAVSQGVDGYYFVTPSGKWRCAMVTSQYASPMVGCQPGDNTKPSIGVPGAPQSVPNPVGTTSAPNAILIRQGQDPQFAYRGQADFWRFPLEATTTLPYGSTLDAAGFQCNVQESGISCKDDASGKAFTFSDQGYTWTFTPVGADANLGGGQTTTEESNGASRYVGSWIGHGRNLTLNADGSASVEIASGAGSDATWAATWTGTDSGFTVTFGAVTKQFGPMPENIAAGATWSGTLTSVQGSQVIEFSDEPGTYWCPPAVQASTSMCGA